MARLARIVVPDTPHHVTQRGNRRQPIFLSDDDFELYRELLGEQLRTHAVACWAYCLMPNHVHLILTPPSGDALARAIGETHRRYTAFFNARARTTGHLFQGRFHSAALDEPYLLGALRYLAFNPVKAKLARRPQDWRHSSVRAHLRGRSDALVATASVREIVPRFSDLLNLSPAELRALKAPETLSANGRPLGSPAFIAAAEAKLGRTLAPRKRGPKPRAAA